MRPAACQCLTQKLRQTFQRASRIKPTKSTTAKRTISYARRDSKVEAGNNRVWVTKLKLMEKLL